MSVASELTCNHLELHGIRLIHLHLILANYLI